MAIGTILLVSGLVIGLVGAATYAGSADEREIADLTDKKNQAQAVIDGLNEVKNTYTTIKSNLENALECINTGKTDLESGGHSLNGSSFVSAEVTHTETNINSAINSINLGIEEIEDTIQDQRDIITNCETRIAELSK